MKKIFVILLLPIIVLTGGCKKFLDEKPYSFLTGDNFPTNAVQEEALQQLALWLILPLWGIAGQQWIWM